MLKFVIYFILLSSISTVSCSDPWGWQQPSSTYNYDHSQGEGYGHGQVDKNSYDKAHIDKFEHENAHLNGTAAGFVKGAKTDWANYQYGGEGSRAEGDTFEKSFASTFGNGQNSGHSSGNHHNHAGADGRYFNQKNGRGHSPHYSSIIDENEHDPW
uniref:Uncharacterized protein n=1 Tax=Panagrolaimus sp. ES5 TaxID=591445 RepID=A0AC34GAY6_9BILA